MNDLNPYAPPADSPGWSRSGAALSDESWVWREGDAVVLQTPGGELPRRCVVCNAPAEVHAFRKTFYWHSPWLYLALLAGGWLYVLLALVTRKSATVGLPLCEHHDARRRKGRRVGWLGFAGCFFLMVLGMSMNATVLVFGALAGLFVFLLTVRLMGRVASTTRITDSEIHLKVGRPFLESIRGR